MVPGWYILPEHLLSEEMKVGEKGTMCKHHCNVKIHTQLTQSTQPSQVADTAILFSQEEMTEGQEGRDPLCISKELNADTAGQVLHWPHH